MKAEQSLLYPSSGPKALKNILACLWGEWLLLHGKAKCGAVHGASEMEQPLKQQAGTCSLPAFFVTDSETSAE